MGKALKVRDEKPLVFTKCSLVWDEERNIVGNLDKASVKKECEDSLERLDLDCIALYQIHCPNPPEDIEAAWEAMAELQAEGKDRIFTCTTPDGLLPFFTMDLVVSGQSYNSVSSWTTKDGILTCIPVNLINVSFGCLG